jgi:hypothetical protein
VLADPGRSEILPFAEQFEEDLLRILLQPQQLHHLPQRLVLGVGLELEAHLVRREKLDQLHSRIDLHSNGCHVRNRGAGE